MVRINLTAVNNNSSELVEFEITSLNGEVIKSFQIPVENFTPLGVRIDIDGEFIFPKLPGGKYYASCEAFKKGLKVLQSNPNGEYSFYYSPIMGKAYSK